MLFRVVFCLFLALAAAPLFSAGYLPLVDLPQHAAQLSISERFASGSQLPIDEAFVENHIVNHRLAHGLARLFMAVTDVETALWLVLLLAVLGFPLACAWLIHRLRGDKWWSLGAIPLAYNFSFAWGFLNFVVALPLGILLLAECVAYARWPTRKRLLVLIGLCYGLFFSHVLVLVFVGLVGAVYLLFSCKQPRDLVYGLLALLSVLPAIALWWWLVQVVAPPQSVALATKLAYGWYRVPAYFAYPIGGPRPRQELVWLGLLVFLSPLLLGARPKRLMRAYLPLLVGFAVYLVMPSTFLGVAFLFGRYAVFALPLFWFALRPGNRAGAALRARAFGRSLVCVLVCWLALQKTGQYWQFAREAASFDTALFTIPKNERIMYLPFSSASRISRSPAYLHFGQWIAAKRDGIADFSFAEFFPNRYRYAEAGRSHLPARIEWKPGLYDPACFANRYRFVVVRGRFPRPWLTHDLVRLVASRPPWTVLESSPSAFARCRKTTASRTIPSALRD